jgi:hypothetical protein
MAKPLSNLKSANTGRVAVNVLRIASNVADAETVTIGNEVYEIDTAAAPGAITTGNIRVDCNAGVTPTIASAALVAAINGNTRQGLFAVAISVNEVLVATVSGNNAAALVCSKTLAGANNAWSSATMVGGAQGPLGQCAQARVPTAQEVTIGNMHFYFPFAVASMIAAVRVTATGIVKAWGGVLAKSGNRVTLTNNASTDWAATDTVTVYACQ